MENKKTRSELMDILIWIAKNRKSKKPERIAAIKLLLNELPREGGTDDEGAREARELLEALKG